VSWIRNRVRIEARRRGHICNRIHGDMSAVALMRKCELLLHLDKRIVRQAPGVYVGDCFFLG
jgi:hypothetical protein